MVIYRLNNNEIVANEVYSFYLAMSDIAYFLSEIVDADVIGRFEFDFLFLLPIFFFILRWFVGEASFTLMNS